MTVAVRQPLFDRTRFPRALLHVFFELPRGVDALLRESLGSPGHGNQKNGNNILFGLFHNKLHNNSKYGAGVVLDPKQSETSDGRTCICSTCLQNMPCRAVEGMPLLEPAAASLFGFVDWPSKEPTK